MLKYSKTPKKFSRIIRFLRKNLSKTRYHTQRCIDLYSNFIEDYEDG